MNKHMATHHQNVIKKLRMIPLEPKRDAAQLHVWFVMDYAKFWLMRSYSIDQVTAFYEALISSGHAEAWLGLYQDRPAFLVECYDPAFDEVGQHYKPQSGDMGLHLFIGPPTSHIPGFSHHVFAFVLRFMFDQLDAKRIVVEPDVENTKIHCLNLDMGFVYSGTARFKEKTARIAFCTRDQFEQSSYHDMR